MAFAFALHLYKICIYGEIVDWAISGIKYFNHRVIFWNLSHMRSEKAQTSISAYSSGPSLSHKQSRLID